MMLRPLIMLAGACLLISACAPVEPEKPAASSSASAFAVNEHTPSALRFNWHYQRFLEHLVNSSGRVIDNSGARSISTSEGQAYGMWFALLAQDREQFDVMLEWANRNLAEGALGDRLPAWLWGEDADGQWHILDNNPASDADIWMAYALYAAAELWQYPRYAALAERLSRRLLATTTVTLAANSNAANDQVSGLVLLPAPHGFSHQHYVIVNPSYFSLQQFRGLAAYSGDQRWQYIYQSSVQILQQLALEPHGQSEQGSSEPHGVVPDWLALSYQGQLLSVAETGSAHQADVRYGDYDAIRTYLWLAQEVSGPLAGSPLASNQSAGSSLVQQYQRLYQVTAAQGFPPERLERPTGQASGRGGIGFSAVLLAYLAALEGVDGEHVREQMARIVAANPNDYRTRYYTQMLLMFGLSAVQCTEFHADGRLVVSHEVLHGCT